MLLFYEPLANDDVFLLSAPEARHCINVLRKKVGDRISVVNGKGVFYECEILSEDINKCRLKTLNHWLESKRKYKVHLAIAPTKNIARIEWLVEKLVEVGIDEISFILCENSERKHVRMDRITKKIISAMKQSLKATLPTINDPLPFYSFIKHVNEENKCIGHVDFTNPALLKNVLASGKDCCLLIGPEGDFSPTEVARAVENKFVKVSLGEARLRTDTAGLMACHTVHVINT